MLLLARQASLIKGEMIRLAPSHPVLLHRASARLQVFLNARCFRKVLVKLGQQGILRIEINVKSGVATCYNCLFLEGTVYKFAVTAGTKYRSNGKAKACRLKNTYTYENFLAPSHQTNSNVRKCPSWTTYKYHSPITPWNCRSLPYGTPKAESASMLTTKTG